MNSMELLADVCARSMEMLKMTLSDFSDAEHCSARPCPAANHAAWQVGHLISSEASMIGAVRDAAIAGLPADFGKKFTKETSRLDDPAAFPNKGQLLELAGIVRRATIEWIRTLTPQEMEKPAPERMRSFIPTVGHLAMLVPQHAAMHIGQIQGIRRKLGKPLLF